MNMIKNTVRFVAFLAMAASIAPGYAEDIDIYARPSTEHDSALNPNVLIVIDNSANWASAAQHWPGGIKQGEAELNALRTVIGELSDRTNVGLMMFTPGGGGAGPGGRGGYIRFHIRPMTADQFDASGNLIKKGNKNAFSELVGYPSGCVDGPNSLNGTPNCILKNFNDPSEKASSAQTDYSAVMLDIFKYFGGYTHPAHAQDDVAGANVNSSQFGTQRYAGLDSKADPFAYMLLDGRAAHDAYIDNKGTADVSDDELIPALPSDDPNRSKYNSPLTAANSCAKNYVIFIGNGFPSQDSPSTLLGPASLLPTQGVGGDVTQLPLANLASTTTTQTVLLATPACGTYPGATAMESLGACNADSALSTKYPGYGSYSCTSASTCSAGSTTTETTNLGTSACAVYATQSDCQDALNATPKPFPGYGSYSCTNKTACTSTSANPDNPIVTSTACIPDNLNNAANCTAYGNANYSDYSGFSCTSLGTSGCSGGDKKWRIDATTKVARGFAYTMNGITQTTVSSTTFSQHINGTYTTIAAAPDGTFSAPTKINHFDEWARFLNQTDVSSAPGKQNINMFTIDVFNDQQDVNETSLLISAASAGGGKYYMAKDQEAIENALRKIFSEIQAVNSVFASSSLPVSVNTQGTYLNQVFMGMFRPEGSAAPRWPGNVKQYQFKLFGGELRLADKNGEQAVSTTTGFITPCANSFWATDTGNYWNFGASAAVGGCSAQSSAFPVANSTSVYSDAPDGDVVEKGGAAQRLRGVYSSGGALVSSSTNYAVCGAGQTPATASCRLLFTCDGTSPASCGALTKFDAANAAIDATALNLADATQRDKLIDWVRGKDVDNENANLDASLNPIYDEVRPSVHGGVVHAQPAVIDYGGSIGTIAFYGADDGVFHAADGGQSDTDGIELWGFIAPETISKLNRLRSNSPSVAFPGVSGSPAPLPKDYFFDGSVGVYQKVGAGGTSEKVWIYPSMRRGGRAIYAFDVTNPASPVLKWRKGCFTQDTYDDTMCSPDSVTPSRWAGIGQTWSKPQIAYLSGYVDGSSNPKPVLVFGGGYDQCEDANSQTRCTTTPRKGANIWFVDADTGAILRIYPTDYSVPGDLTLLTNANGYLTHVYAADTGGNVYRINVGSTNTAGTTFTAWSNDAAVSQILLARLSQTNHARKFLNGPSIVKTGGFNAVLLGSGDREHPLVTDYACNNKSTTAGNYVTNQFYMLMDKPPAYPSPALTPSDLVDVTSGTTTIGADASGVVTITNVAGGVTKESTKGWRFDFGQCEQSVNKALVVAGITYFGTNAPRAASATSCTANLGHALGYAVDYLTGNPIPASKEEAQALAEAADQANTLTGVGLVGDVVNGAIVGADGNVRATRHSEYIGGGMPPSPVSGVVDIAGTKYPFCIGCIDPSKTSNSASEAREPPISFSSRRYKTYWYIETDE